MKFPNKKLSNVFRVRGDLVSRKGFLRLERNERVKSFQKKFTNYLKKNITSYEITSYPDLEKVYNNLSRYLKIDKKNIIITGGADLAIKNCFELFVQPKSKIITINPTFAMIDIYSKLFQTRPIKFNFDKNLKIDTKKIEKKIKKNIKMVIISNPNNPTGTIISKKDMLSLISKANKLNIPFVIDEVYYGFSNLTLIDKIKKYKNLVIIRTFSKSFGLAALRAGYIVANKLIAQQLFKFKPMYEINSITALAVNYMLKNKNFEKKYLQEVKEGKKFLLKSLRKLKIDHIDTPANFIHIRVEKINKTREVVDYLKRNKILVRSGGPGVKGFENYLRITLSDKNDMKKLIFYLRKKIKHITSR